MDVPGDKSSHTNKVPSLGGVAIYFAIVIVTSIFSADMLHDIVFFSAALALLFFVGLVDDLLVVAPSKKLYAKIISALMIVVGSDIRIDNFFGLFEIYELPFFFSIIFTSFINVLIINYYKFIDGIDSLEAGVGILNFLSFVVIFFIVYEYCIGYLAIATMAALLSFLCFIFLNRYKKLIGETGSMVFG